MCRMMDDRSLSRGSMSYLSPLDGGGLISRGSRLFFLFISFSCDLISRPRRCQAYETLIGGFRVACTDVGAKVGAWVGALGAPGTYYEFRCASPDVYDEYRSSKVV